MPRIAGIMIPDKKRIEIALTYIYGIGSTMSVKILNEAKIDVNKISSELTQEEINRLREIIEKKYRIEGDLRRDLIMNIKELKDIACWRGVRHSRGMPTRGQRTKTNSRTVRGNVRKTVGSGRKPVATPA